MNILCRFYHAVLVYHFMYGLWPENKVLLLLLLLLLIQLGFGSFEFSTIDVGIIHIKEQHFTCCCVVILTGSTEIV